MSIKVVISMEIADFDSLSSIFNSDEAKNARKEVGIIAELHKNLDNPNNIVIISTAPSKEAFGAFFSSPAQKQRMQNAGVVSSPIVTFLEA